MLAKVFYLMKNMALKLYGTPEISFIYRNERFILQIRWTHPLMTYEHTFNTYEIARMDDEDSGIYLERTITSINEKYKAKL